MTARSFWLEGAPAPRPALRERMRADVVVVGAGFTGLWTALALTRGPGAPRVVVCEAETVGYGASGRNGGFVDASLTHGLANGVRHFPDEIDELERLGRENFAGFATDITQLGIDSAFEPTGMLDVAVEGWQAAELDELAALHDRFGEPTKLLDAEAARARVNSPRFLAGLYRSESGGVVNPAALARGLADAVERAGVELYERSPVTRLACDGRDVVVATTEGEVRADRAILATNAYSAGLLPRTRRHFVPIYDYVLVTEPLSHAQQARIGWSAREGVADSGNQFHYFRLTADDRILWGGYDAVYYPRGGVGPRYDDRPATYATLERHFRATFPQLGDLAFTHRWGGAIATTTRFMPVFGEALDGRLLYALGYTGLGVATTRFAGQVLADRVLAPHSPLLRLRYVTSRPFPFPPEPLRTAGITLVRRALARADRREGRRGALLGVLDRLGIGFDS